MIQNNSDLATEDKKDGYWISCLTVQSMGEIEALAITLADEFIQNLQSIGGIDGAIQKMTETIAEGQELLPEVSSELKQRSGKGR